MHGKTMEDTMELANQSDHVAILALMISGVLVQRLNQIGQLDDATARQLHNLTAGVRTHANTRGLTDLKILFDNIDRALGDKVPTA
jgi:hypothetical protein